MHEKVAHYIQNMNSHGPAKEAATQIPRPTPSDQPCFCTCPLKLSSCQIFNVNVKNQDPYDSLGGLSLLLEYGARLKEIEGRQDTKSRPFQRLEFLFRDWQMWGHRDDPARAPLDTLRQMVCPVFACIVVGTAILCREARRRNNDMNSC